LQAKWAGREADHSPPSSGRSRVAELYLQSLTPLVS
jgi:hypothetical protein